MKKVISDLEEKISRLYDHIYYKRSQLIKSLQTAKLDLDVHIEEEEKIHEWISSHKIALKVLKESQNEQN